MVPLDLSLEAGEFVIRPPNRSEAKAFRMILPLAKEPAVALVAVIGAVERVVAAAALTRTPRPKPPVGPGVAIHVIAPCRRKGIGSALVDALKQAARQQQADALYATQRVEQGGPEDQGWRWLGFRPIETVVYHELPLAGIEPRLGPLFTWMKQQGSVPDGAEIISLCDADHDAIADLHVQVMGGQRAALMRRLRGAGLGAYHPVYSRVLLIDGNVVGCILAHRESKDVAVVDANILHPDVRGGWANIWLKLEATRNALELGIERFIYSTFDHYADTRIFTEKLGGVETRTTLLMCCHLDGPNRNDETE